MSIRERLLVVVVLYWRARSLVVQLLTLILLVGLLLVTSVFLYGSFYYWYMPSVLHERPVHFRFRTDCEATEKSCGFLLANLSLVSNDRELLMYGQPYIAKLQLEMPESAVNQRLGMFMVELRFYTHYAETVYTVARSTLMSYKSWLYRTLETLVFFGPSLVLNFPVQKQLVTVELCDGYFSDPYRPTFGVLLEVQTRRIEIYKASFRMHAKFSGLRFFMFHWPMVATVFGVAANFFFLSMIAVFSWFAYMLRSNEEIISGNDQLTGKISTDSTDKTVPETTGSSRLVASVNDVLSPEQPDSTDAGLSHGVRHRTVSKE